MQTDSRHREEERASESGRLQPHAASTGPLLHHAAPHIMAHQQDRHPELSGACSRQGVTMQPTDREAEGQKEVHPTWSRLVASMYSWYFSWSAWSFEGRTWKRCHQGCHK